MKVFLRRSENLHLLASARHFSGIHVDEPESFHGTDRGPSSVEYFLIGLGGCFGNTFTHCLNLNGVEVEDLEIEVDGKLKHVPPKMYLRIVEITVHITLEAARGSDLDTIQHCIDTFQDHCVIQASILRGIPIHVEIKKEKNED